MASGAVWIKLVEGTDCLSKEMDVEKIGFKVVGILLLNGMLISCAGKGITPKGEVVPNLPVSSHSKAMSRLKRSGDDSTDPLYLRQKPPFSALIGRRMDRHFDNTSLAKNFPATGPDKTSLRNILNEKQMLVSVGQAIVPPMGQAKGISPPLMVADTLDYVLGPEDVLEVNVWKNKDISKVVVVRPDGKISLPLIGDVKASGLTVRELKDSIISELTIYKDNPVVSVIVQEVNSLSVFVLGEVARPGKLKLRSDTTVLQALTLAGGFTEYASTNKIILLRRINGEEERLKIKYKKIISGEDIGQNIFLKRGDTLVVP